MACLDVIYRVIRQIAEHDSRTLLIRAETAPVALPAALSADEKKDIAC